MSLLESSSLQKTWQCFVTLWFFQSCHSGVSSLLQLYCLCLVERMTSWRCNLCTPGYSLLFQMLPPVCLVISFVIRVEIPSPQGCIKLTGGESLSPVLLLCLHGCLWVSDCRGPLKILQQKAVALSDLVGEDLTSARALWAFCCW